MKQYLIDANTLITPYHNYYPFDFAPGFWNQMEAAISEGSIVILDVVRNEILKGEDELSDWLERIEINNLVSIKNLDILNEYRKVLTYVQHQDVYKSVALMEWARIEIADPWLIATALSFGYTIVTFERQGHPNAGNPSKNAKIPDVANHFNVSISDLYTMMRELNFHL